MRVIWEMYEDEIAWTTDDKYDDTIEIIEVNTDMIAGPVRTMCAEVPSVTDIHIENRMSKTFWIPSEYEVEGDNTVVINDFTLEKEIDED